MLRSDYERDLSSLQADLREMATHVEQATRRALNALENQDLELAQQIIDEDDHIDRLQDALEDKCVTLMATQQPMAIDLRALMSAVHIGVELERMGDYAEGIAKICLRIGNQPLCRNSSQGDGCGSDLLEGSHRRTRAVMEAHSRWSVPLPRMCVRPICRDIYIAQIYTEDVLVSINITNLRLEDPRNTNVRRRLWGPAGKIADRATNIAEV